MFRPARWRTDKSKIKAVFKLQFHATQVSLLGVDALTLSVVAGDTGKPTVRLEKAVIGDGGCRWESPVYETVKFSRDPKTGKLHERVYHFILSTGTGKSGFVGEVSVDFAEYSEATKASSVSLPIKNSNAKAALLHVSIQRQPDTVDQREVEENEGAKNKVRDRSLRSQFNNSDREEIIDGTSTEDVPALNQTIRNVVENGNFSTSSGSDHTTSSESSSGLNTPRENTARSNNIIQREPNGIFSSLSSVNLHHEPVTEGAIVVYEGYPKSQLEHSHSFSQDSEVSEEAGPGTELDRLRSKLSSLARQADLSDLELQTLRKQIVKESKRAQELSREVITLKEERDSLKGENRNLRAINERFEATKTKKSKLQYDGRDIQELFEELNYEKSLNSDLRLQLQKTQESNTELILAVRDLEEMLEKKDMEISNLGGKLGTLDEEDEEQKALEAIVRGQKDAKETYLLEQKILDLHGEVEIYRRDRDELEIQMEQLALDYEILKQKHHEISYKWEQSQLQEQLKLQYECCSFGNEKEWESKVARLESELQMRSEEFTESLATIIQLESKIKVLESELQTRSEEFTGSLAALSELKSKIQRLEGELQTKSDEFTDSLATISELESNVRRLEGELKMKSEELSDSLASRSELESKVERLEGEVKKRSEESSDSLATISELESKIERLEGEDKKMSEELSTSLATISELETQVKDLEEEMESRAQEFENDLRDVTRAKVKQEKRAISAEEALQKMRWKNFETADRLQEQFTKLSAQMASNFESNERVAIKAVREAAELRKANEKLQLMNNEYGIKVEELSREIQEKSKQLEVEIMRLGTEYDVLSARAGEAELAVEKGNAERSKLVSSIALLKKELEEKNVKVGALESELETLKIQCDELKGAVLEDEAEKESLRKEVLEVAEELKKKESALLIIEKKLEEGYLQNNKCSLVECSGNEEVTSLQEIIRILKGQIKERETELEGLENSFCEKDKEFTTKIVDLESRLEELQKGSKCLEGSTLANGQTDEIRTAGESGQIELEGLSTELAVLKEKNGLMEIELKEMQQKYSEISLRFAEVEGERQKLVMTVRYLKNARKK
ncbi:hypothetical protein CDL15_Pgr017903 [Punica granatum]|uniref:C2 NT-type domain-containing protein n=1 Tax=Punica granatum TaxID=22663 RepID=A0A218WI23_PUNGR|nr:hypothetical protein CDL15_Pgr017903 [Punica granatum]